MQASLAVYLLARIGQGGFTPLGTAFAVSGNRIATALHVTAGNDAGLVLIAPHGPGTMWYQDTSLKNYQTLDVRIVATDPVRDLAILEFDFEPVTHLSSLSSMDDAAVGSRVATLGFPHADTGRLVLTYRSTDIGAHLLIENSGVKSKYGVINLQGRPGQSGSPVIGADGSVVGILVGGYAPPAAGSVIIAGLDPTTLHETTHAISAEYLKDMINV